MNDLARLFGPVTYPVPKDGEHDMLSCWIGDHWWSVVRNDPGQVVAVLCPVCEKVLKVHDLDRGS